MAHINHPFQKRSQETQRRILEAFESLLSEQFLDDITVRQIAAKAGITPGAIYRRFANKEALLPVLYGLYVERLELWASEIWTEKTLAQFSTLEQRVEHLVKEHISFFDKNTAILRTIHLNARTTSWDLARGEDPERVQIYATLLEPVAAALTAEGGKATKDKFQMFIFFLITSVTEAVLFKECKPASLVELNIKKFTDSLVGYLVSGLRS